VTPRFEHWQREAYQEALGVCGGDQLPLVAPFNTLEHGSRPARGGGSVGRWDLDVRTESPLPSPGRDRREGCTTCDCTKGSEEPRLLRPSGLIPFSYIWNYGGGGHPPGLGKPRT
jgi:hypothetical protein